MCTLGLFQAVWPSNVFTGNRAMLRIRSCALMKSFAKPQNCSECLIFQTNFASNCSRIRFGSAESALFAPIAFPLFHSSLGHKLFEFVLSRSESFGIVLYLSANGIAANGFKTFQIIRKLNALRLPDRRKMRLAVYHCQLVQWSASGCCWLADLLVDQIF